MKRIKNTVSNKDRERVLSRVATRGVVKFFNVVQQQQKDIQTKVKQAGPYERKIDKVYNSIDKKSFLERLRESNDVDNEDNENIQKIEDKNDKTKPSWNVLREDFIMGGEMKDWDKGDAENGEDEDEEELDGDFQNGEKIKNKKNNKNQKGKNKRKNLVKNKRLKK